MKNRLSDRAEKVIAIARREARQLDHEYVGTEHLLLALLVERSDAIATLDVTAADVRAGIEKLVQRGKTPVSIEADLPLTPRAKRALAHARLEASAHSQRVVEPEHILIGLVNEPDGVAGQVMRSLGLDLTQVRRESLKLQLAQMRIVERAVRPVRAGAQWKRRSREELLAHFAGIFDEELSRANDSQLALAEASKRFGDPAELAAELDRALPAAERRRYQLERWFCWRAPESVSSMMLRASLLTCGLVLALAGVPLLVLLAVRGWKPEIDVVAWRSVGAVAVVLPVAQFLIGVCFYKMRDALFGVFGSNKSLRGAMFHATLLATCVAASGAGLVAIMNAGLAVVREMAPQLFLSSVFAAAFCMLIARLRGPAEIRDTVWSCLDLNPAE